MQTQQCHDDLLLLALYATWLQLRRVTCDDDEISEDAIDAERNAFERLVTTPAQSLSGVCLKLNAACISDDLANNEMVDGQAIVSALRDTERLAGWA